MFAKAIWLWMGVVLCIVMPWLGAAISFIAIVIWAIAFMLMLKK